MSVLRVVVADDEPLARARLQRLLRAEAEVELVGTFADAPALLVAWPLLDADVLLLDVQMPELDGFAALQQLQPPPAVVFVTAHPEHAVRAFTVDAADYVLKPVDQTRLHAALERVRKRLASTVATAQAAPASRFPQRMALPIGRRIEWIQTAQIDYVRAQANYIELHVGARSFVLRRPLAALERELDPAQFVRIHRSLLLRIAAVSELQPAAAGRFRIQLSCGAVLGSGRSYGERVRQVFGL